MPPSTTIPVVSFERFLNGDHPDQEEVARQVYAAFSTIGFVYLKDHGIPQTKVDEIFALAKTFFALPLTSKLKYKLSSAHINQGYTADGAEGIHDHKECYEHRRFSNALCPSESELPGFKRTLDAFYAQCLSLALDVLKCLAMALELGDDGFFRACTTHTDPQLRLIHYPPLDPDVIDGLGHARIMPHTDFGLCTLLFQDDVGGLEVDPAQNDEFVPAPPIEGTVLVNIADLMQRYTNGRVRSTRHRVVKPAPTKGVGKNAASYGHAAGGSAGDGVGNGVGADGAGDGVRIGDMLPARFSIPFFVHPDPETIINPITLEEGEVKLYEPVNAGEWREWHTAMNYGLEGE